MNKHLLEAECQKNFFLNLIEDLISSAIVQTHLSKASTITVWSATVVLLLSIMTLAHV